MRKTLRNKVFQMENDKFARLANFNLRNLVYLGGFATEAKKRVVDQTTLP
jgi:hypothetical protein